MKMTSLLTMPIQYLVLLIYAVESVNIEINGELSFDLKISNIDLGTEKELETEHPAYYKSDFNDAMKDKDVQSEDILLKVLRAKLPLKTVTSGPMVECLYQYPEKEQVNAMLSHMMNALTKVFIRSYEFLRSEDARPKQETRFRVVDKKETDFFEKIYGNMTQEYSQFYNNTAQRVDRHQRDPCSHQEEVKQMWKELLEKSVSSLKTAALQCVDEYFKAQNRNADTKTKNQLGQFLLKELGKFKSTQLDVLCDSFQLCFNELL